MQLSDQQTVNILNLYQNVLRGMSNMAQAFGIVSFAGNNIRVGEMQNYRPVGAVSFLGRYRVIDFPISNMSNSEIEHIQVYVRRKPRSLTEHLGTGRSLPPPPSSIRCRKK